MPRPSAIPSYHRVFHPHRHGAVYTLLNVDRGVPEAGAGVYDIRDLLDATVKLRDGKKVTDMEMNVVQKLALKEALKKLEGTEIEKLLKEYNVI